MARNESERRQRPPEGHNTSKGARPQPHMPFSGLFGSKSAASPKRRRPSGDQDRDRDRGRDRDLGRSRNKDQDRGHDRDPHQDQHHDKKHHQKHEGRGRRWVDEASSKHCHRHKHRHHSRERLLVDVELKSLDDRYINWKVGVHPGFLVSRFESYIRRRYDALDKPIAPSAQFIFFLEGEPLKSTDEITQRSSTIWYRMSKHIGELETWKFTHWQDDTNGRLDSTISDELVKAIDEGATVGLLRKKVAELMKVDDPYRVVLIARGGMRPGLLQGENWEARQVKKWLCCWISIDVKPEKCYVILRGLGREYVYHPDAPNFERGMELRGIQSYIRHRLFRAVCLRGKSKFDLSFTDVVLSRDGSCPGSFTPVQWGVAYAFEIPQDAAETFADEETWLLTPTESCAVCLEDKKISEMPIKVTSECRHRIIPCKDCLKQWLQSSLERTTWDRLKCPDCPALLNYTDMRRYASAETFARYDALSTRSAAEALPNFRWCLSATCESGQIDDENCPKFKCQACGAKQCIKHNVPWHKGETCEEYERRNKQRKKDDKASEQTIKKTSKKCPQCKKDVHKFIGCNHITCVCGHEWCYICFAPFQRNEHGFLFCRHTPECTERDPFIDLIDPNHANRIPHFRPPPHRAGAFPRPPPGFMPEFIPPHLRRQNVNAAGGAPGLGGIPNNRMPPPPPRPPPGFPFPEPFDRNGNPVMRPRMHNPVGDAALRMAAAAMAAQMNRAGQNAGRMRQQNQDPAEGGIPQFAGLHI